MKATNDGIMPATQGVSLVTNFRNNNASTAGIFWGRTVKTFRDILNSFPKSPLKALGEMISHLRGKKIYRIIGDDKGKKLVADIPRQAAQMAQNKLGDAGGVEVAEQRSREYKRHLDNASTHRKVLAHKLDKQVSVNKKREFSPADFHLELIRTVDAKLGSIDSDQASSKRKALKQKLEKEFQDPRHGVKLINYIEFKDEGTLRDSLKSATTPSESARQYLKGFELQKALRKFISDRTLTIIQDGIKSHVKQSNINKKLEGVKALFDRL